MAATKLPTIYTKKVIAKEQRSIEITKLSKMQMPDEGELPIINWCRHECLHMKGSIKSSKPLLKSFIIACMFQPNLVRTLTNAKLGVTRPSTKSWTMPAQQQRC